MTETSKSIYDDYFALHKKHAPEFGQLSTVVLMQVGVFYEMYGLKHIETQEIRQNKDDPLIIQFSQICELAIACKSNCFYENKTYHIIMCGFKDDYLDKYMRKMQHAGFTVVLYNQVIGKTTGKPERVLFTIVSPGTYCENNSDDNDTTMISASNNTICCVWFYVRNLQSSLVVKNKDADTNQTHKMHIGISSVDIYTGKTVLYEFSRSYNPNRNNPNLFDPLDRFFTIYSPVELIVIAENLTQENVCKILKSVNVSQVKKTHTIIMNQGLENDAQNILHAKNCEKQIYQMEVLSRFYPDIVSNTVNTIYMNQFYEYVMATQSFCYLLDFIHQHNTSLTKQIFRPVFDHVGDHLQLENSSLIQLNILDDGNQLNARYASVAKMCQTEALTPMGKRQINEMILHPVTNPNYLNREYNIVEHAMSHYTNAESRELIQQLSSIRDLSRYMRLICWKRITPKQLYFMYENMETVKKMYSFFSKDPTMDAYFQETQLDYSHMLVSLSKITTFLDSVLNIDKCKNVNTCGPTLGNELYILKKTANAELNMNLTNLYDSRDKLECCRTFLDSLLKPRNASTSSLAKECDENGEDENGEDDEDGNEEFGSNKGKNVKISCTKTNNYTLSATELRCQEIAERLNELHATSQKNTREQTTLIHISYTSSNSQKEEMFSLKNGKEKVFVPTNQKSKSKSTSTANEMKPVIEFIKTSARSKNRYIKSEQLDECAYILSQSKKTISETIRRAYMEVLEKLEDFDGIMQSVIHYVASVDAIMARAFMAEKNGYCKPEIVERSTSASFVDAQNLRHCIIEKIQTDEIYVANDIRLDSNGILLYGVNAVGKTSLIRALGIAVIMAQAGFYTSASQFKYKPYTKLFTRILGNDSIAKGLSTFVVEMLELNPILRYADQNSIVLGDELCSGTETPSAISLNVASLMKLCNQNVSFILATHYHELPEMEEIQSLTNLSIMHMSMFYDRAKDTLVYNRKLQSGVGSNKYGLEVCNALGFKEEFLEVANKIRLKYYGNTGQASILGQKTSSYNSAHVRGMCQKCGMVMASEVHHKQPQKQADKNGLILDKKTGSVFHKNHPANLMNVCEKCHLAIHHDI